MKKTFLNFVVALLAMALASPIANAAVVGETSLHPSYRKTYMSSSAFTTPAGATTDFAQLYGNASNTTRVMEIDLAQSGSAAGGVVNKVFVLKRSTANSAGTATTETAVPCDSANTAVSVAKTYTANPTTGALVGRISSTIYNPPLDATAADGTTPYVVLYKAGNYEDAIRLKSTSEGVVVNFNGVIPGQTTPLCAVRFVWVEE